MRKDGSEEHAYHYFVFLLNGGKRREEKVKIYTRYYHYHYHYHYHATQGRERQFRTSSARAAEGRSQEFAEVPQQQGASKQSLARKQADPSLSCKKKRGGRKSKSQDWFGWWCLNCGFPAASKD
ncbi:predicted protein [Histoplasma capsulatum var. duboisii H88]|uniref:Predicted protein n=2 Tax=Ajellomyces capsulatus TaxID=5037 RepID=F0ULN0_AJEC8|nr:predicted protein [Histoplasma capsulatum H143]EGC47978.1 predicted protein [Histoplasma capsulatum var. duboisii H88]